MSNSQRRRLSQRILAIDPTPRGFAFSVVEGTDFLVDWGAVRVPVSHPERTLLRIAELIRSYRPHTIVLENPRGQGSRRCARVASLLGDVKTYVTRKDLRCIQVSREAVRRRFSKTGTTKHAISRAVVEIFPELEPRLPPIRKPWMSEDERMAIFDATSFALTGLSLRDRTTRRSAAP